MSEEFTILIVDDDRQIRTMVKRYLQDERFAVLEAADGSAMRSLLDSRPIDLVLLDLTLPGEDGLTLARHIRQSSTVPIIMLTGKSDVIDRVAGLEAGADDYMAKPFHLRELLARIRTVLRRTPAAAPAPASVTSSVEPGKHQIVRFDQWRVDLHRRCLFDPAGQEVTLTASEFNLLKTFIDHSNRVLSRDMLMDLTKGHEWSPYDRSIDTQIGRLRKKIEANTETPSLIKTVRGAGYIFTAMVQHE